jgi:hypothetical protein
MAKDYKVRLKGKNNPNYRAEKDKICPTCGKVFHPNNNSKTYCSVECYNKSEQKIIDSKNANNSNRKPPRKCPICGADTLRRNKYCPEHNPNKKIEIIGVCLNCGKKVKSTYNVQYCKECRASGLHKKEVYSICSNCGKKIPDKYGRKYCDFCFGQKMRVWRGTPRKKDANQNEIVKELEKHGCSVLDTSAVGGGFPDIIVGKNDVTLLMEIKNPKTRGKLNKLQKKWFAEWNGQVDVVYTKREAVEIVDRHCKVEDVSI